MAWGERRAAVAGRVLAWLVVLVSLPVLDGCAGGAGAPVARRSVDGTASAASRRATRPRHYRVVAGDTLFGIAWRYGLDYHDVARWNGLAPPYTIYPGQRLRLYRPVARRSRPQRSARTSAARERKASAAASSGSRLRWQWPARGRVRVAKTALGARGIEIEGREGDPVRAAAPGKVVYSGSGLRGYGKLIIIKHDDTFLSAYAHNRKLLVREGARVRAGQQIAEMGRDGSGQPVLHFEIRRRGKPVPPRRYLPQS